MSSEKLNTGFGGEIVDLDRVDKADAAIDKLLDMIQRNDDPNSALLLSNAVVNVAQVRTMLMEHRKPMQ